MQYTLPKKWRTLYWAAAGLFAATLILLITGMALGGGVLLALVCIVLFTVGVALAIVSCLKLRCPICGGPVDRQALLHDHFFCPKCGTNIAMK